MRMRSGENHHRSVIIAVESHARFLVLPFSPVPMLDADQVAPLSSAQEKLLHNQEITRESPGSILRDVDTMLDLVGEDGLRVSESRGAIYTKRLSEINEQLTHSLEADYKRLTQKAFPTIAGLNLLLRAAALVRIDRTDPPPRMVRNEEIVASWHTLNPTEQYMSLQEAWLNRADEEKIFKDRRPRGMSTLVEVLRAIQQIPPMGAEIESDARNELRYRPGYLGLALIWMFGLVEIEERGTAAGEPWKIDRINLPAFGKTLLRRLGRALIEKQEALEKENPPDVWTWGVDVSSLELARDELQHVLQPYFPEWEQHLDRPHTDFRPAPHVFTVELYDQCRWRVAAPGTASLDALSSCLLRAAQFDRDHLYCFFYEDPYGHEQRVNDPRGFLEPPFADEMRVGELPIRPGIELTYRYDFGDRWDFNLTLDAVGPGDVLVDAPTILETEGERPEQYPGW